MDTAAVQQVVDACHIPPVAVGHSYGGSVITGLQRVRRLVYVAAFVPAAGESGALLGGPGAPINSALQHNGDGSTSIQPELAREVLYDDCTDADASWATALLVPQQPGHGRGIPERTAWQSLGSTYVLCEEDKALDPGLQECMARRCGTKVSIKAGHSPFISRPADVARVIMSV